MLTHGPDFSRHWSRGCSLTLAFSTVLFAVGWALGLPKGLMVLFVALQLSAAFGSVSICLWQYLSPSSAHGEPSSTTREDAAP
ncbi:MAG: hypothetical protein AAGD10_21490 [Myxococcota bacterium]